MILQIGGLGIIIGGIRMATSRDYPYESIRKGKFDFWYQ